MVPGRPRGRRAAARAALWALPGHAVPTDIVLIAADWDDDELSGGLELLPEVHELARSLGAKALSHHVDSPPDRPSGRRTRTRGSGCSSSLATSFFGTDCDGCTQDRPCPRNSRRLSRRRTSERTFVEAIASTYEGTRDSWINQNDEHGAIGAARADSRLPADGAPTGVGARLHGRRLPRGRDHGRKEPHHGGHRLCRRLHGPPRPRPRSGARPEGHRSWWLAGRPRSGATAIATTSAW